MVPRIAALNTLVALITLAALIACAPGALAADWSNQGGNAGRNGLTSEIGPGAATLAGRVGAAPSSPGTP